MQLNPARGRKHSRLGYHKSWTSRRFMQLNPARGRKRAFAPAFGEFFRRFMQLNPARGRKHELKVRLIHPLRVRFMQLNPARGRKHSIFS